MNNLKLPKSTELVDQSSIGGRIVGEVSNLGGPFERFESLIG